LEIQSLIVVLYIFIVFPFFNDSNRIREESSLSPLHIILLNLQLLNDTWLCTIIIIAFELDIIFEKFTLLNSYSESSDTNVLLDILFNIYIYIYIYIHFIIIIIIIIIFFSFYTEILIKKIYIYIYIYIKSYIIFLKLVFIILIFEYKEFKIRGVDATDIKLWKFEFFIVI